MSILPKSQLIKPAILDISVVAQTKLFEIEKVRLRFSNGEQREYERFKPSSNGAVMVLAIDQEQLLLVHEYAVGTERYELGFVKGGIDINETPEQSANRELQEEIGFAAQRLIHLRTVNTSPSYTNNSMHIFLALDLFPCEQQGDEPEPLELVRLPLTQLEQLLNEPNFSEARNLVALYALRDWLANRNALNLPIR